MNNPHSVKKDRKYVISPYYADDNGNFRPELPDLGPCDESDDCPCRICVNHYRKRKTGPFDFSVVECKIHAISFTIYPPGYAPFQRQPLAPVASDGDFINRENDVARFEGSYFKAAIDAANFDLWPYQSDADYNIPRRITQKRHLGRAALILGVAPELTDRVREELAKILSLPGQLLHDSAALMKQCPGLQKQGKSICCILNVICKSPSIFERLAEAGAKVCLWPPPKRWDPHLHIFRSSPHLSHIP
ncbi:MAG: hypothetical protein GY846_06950 [Deltaproteobacteria bacterium]|nr:hypothetical protein [Deltaproteobacteria bacterium]